MALPSRVNVTARADWSATSGTTFPSTATSATAGNTLIVVAAGLSTAGQTITGVTDTAGNTYTKIVHVYDPADNHRQEVWVAKNIAGNAANIVTPTWSAAVAFRGIVVVQYAGLDPAGSVDGFAIGTAAGTATSVTTATLTTAKWDDLHLLIPAWALGDTATYPPGFGASFSGNVQTQISERFVVGSPYVGPYTITHTNATFPKSAIAVACAPVDTLPAARVTQAAAEVLTAPVPAAHVTQAVVELLTPIAPPLTIARVTQASAEVLTAPVPAAHVTQAALEVLSLPPVHVTQVAIELLSWQPDPGRRLTVGGIDRTAWVDAESVSWVLNERARATIVLGDFLPDQFEEVVIYAKNGATPIFGGLILTRNFVGRNQYDPTFTVSLECGDYFTYADWVTVTKTYDTAASLKTVLQDLVTDYLGAYGITLDETQVDGPALDPFVWNTKRASDAIRELSDRTGYVAQVSPTKALRMFLPATDTAPAAMTEAAPHCQEVAWTDSDKTVANKVTVIAGPNGQADVDDEAHEGDGATRTFPLYAPYVTIHTHLTTLPDGIFYDVGIYGADDLPYTYDASINAIQQRADQPLLGPAGPNTGFLISYIAAFPFQVSASTGATPVIEVVETRTDVLSIPAAQEIANGLLAQYSSAGRELAIRTDEDGFLAGQALTLDLPITRQVAGAFTITEVSLTIVLDVSPTDNYWQYMLKAIESTTYAGSYLDDWRRITVAPTSGADAPSGRRRI